METCPKCRNYSYEYEPALGRFVCLRNACSHAEKKRQAPAQGNGRRSQSTYVASDSVQLPNVVPG